MNLRNKWTMSLLTLSTAAVIGLTAGAVNAESTTPTPEQTPAATAQSPDQQSPTPGQDHNAILAQVLGISSDQLQTAMVKARDAVIAQALADGKITQAQADALKAGDDLHGLDR